MLTVISFGRHRVFFHTSPKLSQKPSQVQLLRDPVLSLKRTASEQDDSHDEDCFFFLLGV